MAKQGKQSAGKGLVPKLRFPEFTASGSWRPKTLAQLENEGAIKLGRGNVISHKDMRATPGNYPVYSSSAAGDGCMGRYGLYMFDREMITWSIDGGGKFFHRAAHKFSVTNVCGYIDVHSDKISCRFLVYQLQNLRNHKVFDYQLKAHPSVIRKLYSVPVTSSGEQQKIADCLSSLDERIAFETRRLDALKTHKQGLLQQLFPRENETVPRLRFSAFVSGAEWRHTKVAHVITTVTPPKKLRTADYKSQGRYPVVDQSKTLVAAWTDDRSALVVADTPVVVFGDHTCMVKIVRVPFAQGADGIKIIRAKSGVSVEFIYQFLCARPIPQMAYKRHFSALKELGFSYSLDIAEQQKIADCLTSLDNLIAAQAKKIDLLKQHKRGLMRQLFPVLETDGV